MLTGPRGLFLIAGQEKVVTVDLERVLTAPPVEHLTVHNSSVLVTVSMMDGFVNDAFKAERRGLHTREAKELHSKDCVATVWDGLPSIQKSFTRPVYAREDNPVYEVYRNGIMHGMITDYDNDVVASKAWCMLFAVGDWVDSAIEERKEGEDNRQSLVETLRHLSEIQERNAENDIKLKAWKKHQVNLEHPISPDDEVLRSCNDFLEAWKVKNYGALICRSFCQEA